MATEFNYVVNVDTTRVMGAMSEVRSQIGMALGGATGFAGVGGLTGGGSDFSGGASAAFGRMMGGMGGGFKFGTFTNEAMSYMPHHGMVQAHTTLEQERAVNQGGVAAAAQFKPPGVSSAEFAMGVQSNFVDRNITAKYEANVAARSSFYAGVGGLAAGELASRMVGTPLGGAIGAGVATKLFGAGAAKTGKMIGGFAGMFAAYSLADDVVGGAIRGHYAERQMTEGITKELGEIAGAGRNLSRTQKYDLGSAAMGAAKGLNMDVQEMGDILALGRQSGMLPGSADPGKAKQQFQDFARAVEEGAQILHTSLAGATQVIKTATSQGMSAEEGVMRAAGMGGAQAFMRNQAFMNAGAQTGLSMGYTAAQGSSMFGGAIGQAGGAGLTGTEMRIGGGKMAVAREIASTQMAMAKGPLGDMQLMAAMGGEGLGGMMDMPGQAMAAMSQGGDFMSNAVNFMVHKDEYRRGIGAKGIRSMARQQISSMGEIIQDLAPGIDRATANRMAGISMGMTPDQAERVVGGTMARAGGGSGGSAATKSRQIAAMQGTMLSNATQGVESIDSRMSGGSGGFDLNATMTGGMAGMMLGGKGAVLGAGAGLAIDIGQGIHGLLSGPTSAREAAQSYDAEMARAKKKMGYVDIDQSSAQAFLRADLSGARLDLGSAGSVIAGPTAAAFGAMGLQEVAAGAGTMRVGSKYYSSSEVQSLVKNQTAWQPKISAKDAKSSRAMAYASTYSKEGIASAGGARRLSEDIGAFKLAYATIAKGGSALNADTREKYGIGKKATTSLENAQEDVLAYTKQFINNIPDTDENRSKKQELLTLASKPGGLRSPKVRAFMQDVAGVELEDINPVHWGGRAGAVAVKEGIEASMTAEQNFLSDFYGGELSGVSMEKSVAGIKSKTTEKEQSKVASRYVSMKGSMIGMGQMAIMTSGAKSPAREWEGWASITTGQFRKEPTPEEVKASMEAKAEYWEAVTTSEDYIKGKAAAVRGDYDTANKLIGESYRSSKASMGQRGRDLATPISIDVEKKFLRPGAAETGLVTTGAAKAAQMLGLESSANFLKDIAKDILEPTSYAEQAAAEAAGIGKLKKAQKKARRGAQNAVGWGQQEESMALINKSLKRTHKMLEVLEGRIAGTGKNPGGNAKTSGDN